MGRTFLRKQFSNYLGEQRAILDIRTQEKPEWVLQVPINLFNTQSSAWSWTDEPFPKVIINNGYTSNTRTIFPDLYNPAACQGYLNASGDTQFLVFVTGDTGQSITIELDPTSTNYDFRIDSTVPFQVYKSELYNFRQGPIPPILRYSRTDYRTDGTTFTTTTAATIKSSPQYNQSWGELSSTTINYYAEAVFGFTGNTILDACQGSDGLIYYLEFSNILQDPWWISSGTSVVSSIQCSGVPFTSSVYVKAPSILRDEVGLLSGNTITFVQDCPVPSPTPTSTNTPTPTPTTTLTATPTGTPTSTPTNTPTPSTTSPVTPTPTNTSTPTPTPTPLFDYLLAESSDILETEDGDLIEYDS